MQLLYAKDLSQLPAEQAFSSRTAELEELGPDLEAFVHSLVEGVEERQQEIDRVLGAVSREWPIGRMPAVDRAILRLAAYELLFVPERPAAVVVDEAVRLAKDFSTADSPRFVNGVLGALAGPSEPKPPRSGRAQACPRGKEWLVRLDFEPAAPTGRARLLLGKKAAAERRARVRERVAERLRQGLKAPRLLAVAFGHDEAQDGYFRAISGPVRTAGLSFETVYFDETEPVRAAAALAAAASRSDVDGVLLAWPLPDPLAADRERVIDALPRQKDVDALSREWLGRLVLDPGSRAPATARAILAVLAMDGTELEGRRVTLIGHGRAVGAATGVLLVHAGAVLSVVHRPTRDLSAAVRTADVVIAAAGCPGLITADMVRPGAVVVDVGTTEVNGVLVGDVDPKVAEVAGAYAPVPGGVGPLTVAFLLENLLEAAGI